MTINPARLAVSEELLGEGSYGRRRGHADNRTLDTAGGGQDTARDDTRAGAAGFHGRVQEAHIRRAPLPRRLLSQQQGRLRVDKR